MSELLPLFLKLEGRPVLVVGGGRVASQRVESLSRTGARLTVVAPEILPGIEKAGATLHRRAFRPGDLDGVWLAVAAATPDVNREVARAAEERRVLLNAVDDPRNASAYTAGVLRRGGVTIAVSTEGAAPALAGLLREGLEAVLPDDELDRWVASARDLRASWRTGGVPFEKRRPLLLAALNDLYAAREAGAP